MALIKGRIKKRNLGNTPKKKEKAKAKIQREIKKAYREKLLARAKLFGKKTKFAELMRKYNKLQKNWKGKAEYPKIDYLTLEKSNFKMTKANISNLMSQLEGSISKMQNTMDYPKQLLESMLEGCLMNAYKNEIDAAITDRMKALVDDPRFDAACEDGTKAQTIYDLLVLLYDTISVGDESDIADTVSQLYDLL